MGRAGDEKESEMYGCHRWLDRRWAGGIVDMMRNYFLLFAIISICYNRAEWEWRSRGAKNVAKTIFDFLMFHRRAGRDKKLGKLNNWTVDPKQFLSAAILFPSRARYLYFPSRERNKRGKGKNNIIRSTFSFFPPAWSSPPNISTHRRAPSTTHRRIFIREWKSMERNRVNIIMCVRGYNCRFNGGAECSISGDVMLEICWR